MDKGDKKMSAEDHLVLEIDSFTLIGCFGEGTFGRPENIEKHGSIALWIDGLRNPGGGGYVNRLASTQLPGCNRLFNQ